MTTAALMKICVLFECANGIAQIVHPDFFILQILRTPGPNNLAMTRAVGFGSLFLGMACWPIGEAVDPLPIFAQLAYNLCSVVYLGYLAHAGSPQIALLCPACVSHSSLTVLLAGVAYEKAVAAKAFLDSSRE
jgi:hypothetical protein